MFKKIISILVLSTSLSASASEDWCVWDGEEYIKETMTAGKKVWLQVVHDLHTVDSTDAVVTPYEGVGSCRFIDRSLGETPADVIKAFTEGFSLIVATRAYLKMDASNEIVIPEAYYSAGSNWVYVKQNFYSMNRPVCEKQKAQMIELGKQAQGVRFTDVEYKKNKFGGVSAIINGNTPNSNNLGICHFH